MVGKQLDKLKQDGGPIADLLSGLLNIDRSKLSDGKRLALCLVSWPLILYLF